MYGKLKKLVRGSKGMEALQAVLLTGAGFLVVFGLMGLWNSNKGTIETTFQKIISSK